MAPIQDMRNLQDSRDGGGYSLDGSILILTGYSKNTRYGNKTD
jgi:hypothetical protein